MEKNFDDGGQAFPQPNVLVHRRIEEGDRGATLWDYFAAAALSGAAAWDPEEGITPTEGAEKAAKFADAMLAERNKRMKG